MPHVQLGGRRVVVGLRHGGVRHGAAEAEATASMQLIGLAMAAAYASSHHGFNAYLGLPEAAWEVSMAVRRERKEPPLDSSVMAASAARRPRGGAAGRWPRVGCPRALPAGQQLSKA